ncbi:SpoIID/LytB domain protein [Paenibacillus sp. yr247]|uniref:SpoIID/LytB domain-containing protein n=1 Tax=Paenibacillus sp. yr247 TaxID=1761880 RepID=UPI00088C8540|nr:SpoIID/LytB domain-containing protein [Paenibacillus sp. yr247]SDP08207.1 SpoIID/LytB domain protein [Paenibacillus sp. yr247]
MKQIVFRPLILFFCILLAFSYVSAVSAAYGETTDLSPLKEKIVSKNTANRTLELEFTGTLPLSDSAEVFQNVNGQWFTKSLSDVMVGAKNAEVFKNAAGQISRIVLQGETPMNVMRVGIRADISNIADMTQLNHAKVDLRSAQGFQLTDKIAGQSFEIAAGSLLSVSPDNGKMKVTVNDVEVYRTSNRLYAIPASSTSMLQIASIKRALSAPPQYRGVMELFLNPAQDKLRVINEVGMEEYLYQVVPSEMPSSFGLEALKAQAVAARTYALTDFLSSRFADQGFHIDDSTLSQVYNNQLENALTTQAINGTAGQIMKSGQDLVDARFYSTSGGFGASKHEVWSDFVTNQFPGTPLPYLTAGSYTFDTADSSKLFQLNTQDEAAVGAFYKNLSYKGYDSDSLYFRWKVGLTKQELEKTINANLGLRYAADPNFILTLTADGSFQSLPIPAEGIGTFKTMYVAKRGAGGNLTELVVEGSTGTYKIIKEFNIRFTIRPSKIFTGGPDILAFRAKGGATDYDPSAILKNPSILYSAFFTFDIAKDANGVVTGVTFFGGGNGHGVGMSQFGASMLGGKGWTYDKILNVYYPNMQFHNYNNSSLVLTGISANGPSVLKAGESSLLKVSGQYTNGSSSNIVSGVSFTSSASEVASVVADGTLTAHKAGRTIVTATYNGKSAQIEVQVVPAIPVSIQITGLPEKLKTGETAHLTATGTYADGSTADLTAYAAFTSSDVQKAILTNSGELRTLAKGEVTVLASYEGVTSPAVSVKIHGNFNDKDN